MVDEVSSDGRVARGVNAEGYVLSGVCVAALAARVERASACELPPTRSKGRRRMPRKRVETLAVRGSVTFRVGASARLRAPDFPSGAS